MRSWLRSPDGRAVTLLVVVPLVVFVVPALFGYPAVSGDNAIQNLPLRVLAGRMIRQGHLPLWNPYIWSGSPLLGGLNAGAAYPLTGLFAVLPAAAAWVGNLLAVYWAAGLGCYALLRQYRVRPLAALLGGATFAFAGAMAGQLPHLPIVQGMAWLPLLALAELRLAWAVFGVGPVAGPDEGAPGGTPAPAPVPQPAGRWMVLVAGVLAMVLLTGEPRGMADAEIVSLVVAVYTVVRPYAGRVALAARVRYLVALGVAGLWAAALGAVQLFPGWSFISVSQRASESYQYWAAGSLRPSWSLLLLVPDAFGGAGLLGQPRFFNSYNLTEVVGYVGLVPLVGFVALALASFGRRRDRRSGDWGLWLVLAGLGLLLAFGSLTPLGPVFAHIPFYGKLRLQSRNLGLCDLGLAVGLGFFVDRLLGAARPDARWRRWVAAAPALAAAAAALALLADPVFVDTHLGTTTSIAPLGLRPWMVLQLLVALAVTALVVAWPRLAAPRRRRLLVVVVVVDLLAFTAASSTGLVPGHATLEPSSALAARVLGTTGRFGIYDTSADNVDPLTAVGQPDLNVLTRLDSVQGYGSILSERYGDATGAHDLDTLDPCALARGVFVPLRLATLLVAPSYLAPIAPPRSTWPPPPPAGCPAVPAPGTAHQRTWYLGRAVTLRSVALAPVRSAPVRAPRLGLVTAGGAVRWPAEHVGRHPGGGWTVTLVHPAPAAGVVVRGDARAFSDASVVTATDGLRFTLDGIVQDTMGLTRWHYTRLWRGYARFATAPVAPPVWLAHPAPGARARQVSTTDWGTEVDTVTTRRPVELVRSEAWMAGWHAEVAPAAGGASVERPVTAVGLVQGVALPAGSWRVTFLYRPTGLDAGLACTCAGLALAVLVGAVWATRRWRRWRR